jgi:nucleotide-binding universal stress UspA family protein
VGRQSLSGHGWRAKVEPGRFLRCPETATCHALSVDEIIVVGYDGQERSGRALERAIADVKSGSGKLIVVVAEDLPPAPYISPEGLGAYDAGLTEFGLSIPFPDLEHPLPVVQEIIERARKRLEEAGVSGECTWGVGDPAQVILDVAGQRNASRIVIGSHHHGFFARLLGDDVDAEVQKRAAHCEVVLVE